MIRLGTATECDLPAAPASLPPARAIHARATPGVVLRALTGPTIERFRHGEGALLLVTFSWLAICDRSGLWKLSAGLLASLSMLCLYAWNDLVDVAVDRKNPRKNQALVRLLGDHRAPLTSLVWIVTILQVVLAFEFLGLIPALWFAAVAFINFIYSRRMKRVPVLDVLVTGAWGAFYFAASLPPARLVVVIGLMTAVSHLFQMRADRHVDARAGIRTSFVASPHLPLVLVLVLCFLIGMDAWKLTGSASAALSLLPALFLPFVKRDALAWNLTRGAFGLVYAGALWSLHAGG